MESYFRWKWISEYIIPIALIAIGIIGFLLWMLYLILKTKLFHWAMESSGWEFHAGKYEYSAYNGYVSPYLARWSRGKELVAEKDIDKAYNIFQVLKLRKKYE